VKQQHTSTAISILTTKSTYRSLSAQRLSERTVLLLLYFFSQPWFSHVFTAECYQIMWLTLKWQANCFPTQNLEDQQFIYKARTNVVAEILYWRRVFFVTCRKQGSSSNTKLVFGQCPLQILLGALAVHTEEGGNNLPVCHFSPCLQHSNIIESNFEVSRLYYLFSVGIRHKYIYTGTHLHLGRCKEFVIVCVC
jgi:hypothetical protein